VTFEFQFFDVANSTCSLYTNSSGSWLQDLSLSSRPAGVYSFNQLFASNESILWNVRCVDDLGNVAWAPQNRTLYTSEAPPGFENQTIPVNLTVNSTAPSLSVSVESPIDLQAGSTTPVLCSANVTDVNGVADISNVNMTFYGPSSTLTASDDNNTHYTNSSCTCSDINITTQSCSCTFNLQYHAEPGSWTCTAAAQDATNKSSFSSNTGTVNTLLALFVNSTTIDYGDLITEEVSPEQPIDVLNYGNAPIDLSLFGYAQTPGDSLAMNCANGDITVGQQRFSTLSGSPYLSMTSLSGLPGSRNQVDLSVAKPISLANSSNTTYWRLEVPPAASGACSGSVVFQAEVNS